MLNFRAASDASPSETPSQGRVSFNLRSDSVDDDYIDQLRQMQQTAREPNEEHTLTLDAMNQFIGKPAKPGGTEEQQKTANADQQIEGVMTADDLAKMFDDDGNLDDSSEKPIAEQLVEFNQMISAEVAKINYITPELSQQIIAAMSGNDPKGTENFISGMNTAMRNVAVNALNTSFSMLHHHIGKAVDTAVNRANSARDFDSSFSELIGSLPQHFGSDPIRRAFVQKTMREFSRKAPNLKVAAKMTKTFIESMTGSDNKAAGSRALPARLATSSKMLGLSSAQARAQNDFGSMFKGS